jgi:hypothetical protein
MHAEADGMSWLTRRIMNKTTTHGKTAAWITFGTLGAAAIIALACSKDSAAATSTQAKAPVVTVAAGPHVDGKNYVIDAVPGDCTAGANCAVTVKLAAQGEYHINQQYPYKFTATQAAGVTYLGADTNGPNVFTKTAGDFAIGDEKTATMNVKFKAGQKGTVAIGGTFKLSVCSAQNCQLEQQDVSVNVTVK